MSWPKGARGSVWVIVAGTIVLYVFFVTLAQLSPTEVSGVSTVVAALVLAFTVRNLRIAGEIADPAGDPQLRRDRNRMRERRGF